MQFILQFIGEATRDEGGPKREFWHLLGNDIKAAMCAGDNDHLLLDHWSSGICIAINQRMGQNEY